MKDNYSVQQTKKFTVGDQILYDDSSSYYGKLEPKWVGLWTIVEVLYNSLYKVVDHVGVWT